MLVKEAIEMSLKKQKCLILGTKHHIFRALYSGSRVPRRYRKKEILKIYGVFLNDENWIVMEI